MAADQPHTAASSRDLTALLRDLGEGSANLVRDEMRLAKIELSETAASAGRGAAFAGASFVLFLLGAMTLVAALVLFIGHRWLTPDMYWVAALLVGFAICLTAVVLLRRGTALLSPAALAPRETTTTLKDTTSWLRHPKTSVETSSVRVNG